MAAADAAADSMPPTVLTAAEQTALFTGNTIIGDLESFAEVGRDGTTKALLRFGRG